MSIRLLFVRGAGPVSAAIAWFSQGNLSHAGCILPDGNILDSRSDHVGGKPPGVQIRPYGYELWSIVTVFGIYATAEQESKFYEFLKAQIGKPYDKAGILGFVVGRDWREPDSWFCSELQAAALEAAGIVAPLYLAANKITPEALALVCSAIGGRRLR